MATSVFLRRFYRRTLPIVGQRSRAELIRSYLFLAYSLVDFHVYVCVCVRVYVVLSFYLLYCLLACWLPVACLALLRSRHLRDRKEPSVKHGLEIHDSDLCYSVADCKGMVRSYI